MSTVENVMTEETAQNQLTKNLKNAKNVIANPDKIEKFLRNLEVKIKELPKGFAGFSYVPLMGSMINSYFRKKYTKLPMSTIVYTVAALLYVVSPVDLIPDSIPVVGYVDDAAIIIAALPFIKKDLDDYARWRDENDILMNNSDEK